MEYVSSYNIENPNDAYNAIQKGKGISIIGIMCNTYTEFKNTISEYFRTTAQKPEVAGSRLDVEMLRLLDVFF